MSTTFHQSDFITHALRLVVPLRREFGRNVNVQTMLTDPGYASEVFQIALASSNEQVRAEAAYLQRMLGSPRQMAAVPAAGAAPAQVGAEVDSELARLQARHTEKYRLGVR